VILATSPDHLRYRACRFYGDVSLRHRWWCDAIDVRIGKHMAIQHHTKVLAPLACNSVRPLLRWLCGSTFDGAARALGRGLRIGTDDAATGTGHICGGRSATDGHGCPASRIMRRCRRVQNWSKPQGDNLCSRSFRQRPRNTASRYRTQCRARLVDTRCKPTGRFHDAARTPKWTGDLYDRPHRRQGAAMMVESAFPIKYNADR